jgi:hypothetical protein
MLSGWAPVAPGQQGPRGGNEQRSTHRRASDGNKVLGRTTYWRRRHARGFSPTSRVSVRLQAKQTRRSSQNPPRAVRSA